jgi:hypothetical protein
MSGFVDWIGAAADEGDPGAPSEGEVIETEAETPLPSEPSAESPSSQELAVHNFPAGPGLEEARLQEEPSDRNPDLWMYRKRTVGLLRRYMRFSIETGRLPSVIGREFFRAKVTAYTATTFEDRVIFVHDVEACLDRLAAFDQKIIARIILQEYDHERAARVLHCHRKTIQRRLPDLLDEISEEFLKVGMLVPVPGGKPDSEKS